MVRFLIVLMVAIFAVDTWQGIELTNGASPYVQSLNVLTPIKTYLLYADYPLQRELYTLLMNEKQALAFSDLSQETQKILSEAMQPAPFSWVQSYRLITPVFLHANLLHILFNLLWFYVLGRMIEMRAKGKKLLVIFLAVAVVSNTAQYFVTGPLFLGVSGVVCGLAGFIYVRHKRAPWEGYPVTKAGISLLFFYVLFLTLIEIFGTMVSYLGHKAAVNPIANTAHIVGAVTGALLGFYQRLGVRN